MFADISRKNYCLKNHYAIKLGTGWQIANSSVQNRVFNLSATGIGLYFGLTSSIQVIKNENGCYRTFCAMCIFLHRWNGLSWHEYLYALYYPS